MNCTVKSNVFKLSIISFFHGLIPAYVIERLFWEQRGMTVLTVVYVEIIYAAIIVLLEIPTGIIADKWNRKNMMIIAACLSFLEFVLLIFSYSFWQFALMGVMAGIGGAMKSGTRNALLYDSLKESSNTKDYEKSFGRIEFLDLAGVSIATLCGSVIAAKTSLVVNYWISAFSTLIVVAVTLTLIEPIRLTKIQNAVSDFSYLHDAIRFFKKHKVVAFVVMQGIIIGACMNYLDEFWQNYYEKINIPVIMFGVLAFIEMMLRSYTSSNAYKLKQKFSYQSIFTVAYILFTVGMLSIAILKNYAGVIPVIVLSALIGALNPLISGYLQHRAESHIRATLESFQSLVMRGTSIITGLIFGFFANKVSIFAAFGSIGVICVIYGVYFLTKRKIINE